MSYDLSVASRFALPQFTSEPNTEGSRVALAGAIGLFGTVVAEASVSDTFTLSDGVSSSQSTEGAVADTFIMTDTPNGERFRRSDFRHVIIDVWLDDAIELTWIMD